MGKTVASFHAHCPGEAMRYGMTQHLCGDLLWYAERLRSNAKHSDDGRDTRAWNDFYHTFGPYLSVLDEFPLEIRSEVSYE